MDLICPQVVQKKILQAQKALILQYPKRMDEGEIKPNSILKKLGT